MLNKTRMLAAGLFLLLPAATLPEDWDSNGTLSGTDTKDDVKYSATQGTTFSWKVKGSGSGSNVLKVKIFQEKAGGGWSQIGSTKELNMPSDTAAGSFTVKDYREGSVETIKIQFSRKLATKAINWYVKQT